MKTYMKTFAFSLLAVTGMALTSCSCDERIDVVGNPDNLVYFKANTDNLFSTTVAHTPVGDFGELTATFPVRIQRPVSQNTKVTAVADVSMVEAYNEAHNTNYEVLPAEALNFSTLTVTIPQGEAKATEDIEVTLNQSSLAQLTAKEYMLALRIVDIQGDGVGSEDRGVGYIVVNTVEKSIKDISSADEVVGTLLTDYTGWTARYDSGTDIDAASIFDGNVTNGPQLRADGADGKTKVVIVDMGSTHKVSGLRVARYYKAWYGGWWYEQYYFSSVKVECSSDGSSWKELGTAVDGDMPRANGYQHISFYGGTGMRYLRLTIESGSSSVSSLAELGVYISE